MAKSLLLLVVYCISVASAKEQIRTGKSLSDLEVRYGASQDCVDMSKYSHVLYDENRFTLRGYTCENKCEKKTKQICRDVEVTECELEVYADCRKELIETDNLYVDGTKNLDFFPHVCVQDGTEDLYEKGNVAECKTETRVQCDSVWVNATDGYGPQVEKKENCHEVKVENCVLIEKDVATAYPTYDCPLGPAIQYVKPDYDQGRYVSRYARRCEAKALPVCHTRTVSKCKTLTYEECEEEWIRTAVDITSPIPYQEYDHRLKCRPNNPSPPYAPDPSPYTPSPPIYTDPYTPSPPTYPPPPIDYNPTPPPYTFSKNGSVPDAKNVTVSDA